jgi:hypothetical protein
MPEAKKKKSKIPYRNKSPYGWWIASYIERFEYEDEDLSNLNRKCLAWENTILIQAKDRQAAYRKAEKVGRLGDGIEGWNEDGRRGTWRYEGLTSLLLIYEELEDGAEILWKEYRDPTVKKIKSWVKPKHQLETFEDNDEPKKYRLQH